MVRQPVSAPPTPQVAPQAEPEEIVKDDPKPVDPHAQSITITLDQVSEELGIPRARFDSQVRLLANFIQTRRLPAGVCTNEDDSNTTKLCEFVELYENNPTVARQRREAGRRVPLRPQWFGAQQRMSFGRLMKSIHREPVARVAAWAPRLLATTSCPRNLSAVALRKLEAGLPNPRVHALMEKLYAHAAACLQPSEEGYELTHLRQGLLRILWGSKDGARQALERAAMAKDSDDKPRVLYWAGRLQPTSLLRRKFWDRLIEEYPLSFHALEVWRFRNQDPLQLFASRPALTLTRQVENEETNNALRWLEALYVSGYVNQGQRLARWMNSTFKEDLPPSTALYISALKSSKGTPLNTITFLTQQANENPRILNEQTLRLLYPRPYFEAFNRSSSDSDTDTSLILAVARQESGFNPTARSPANAQGLLQLLPSTARRLSGQRRNNLYDVEVNTRLGVRYLSGLINRFGSVELALAGYNAGPGRVDEWTSRYGKKDQTLFMDLIPFKETRHYVANIVRNNYWYERLYSAENEAQRSIASEQKRSQKSDLVAGLVEAHRAARADDARTEEF